jgi:hypothetical protein
MELRRLWIRGRLDDLDRKQREEKARHLAALAALDDERKRIQTDCLHRPESSEGGDQCRDCGKVMDTMDGMDS